MKNIDYKTYSYEQLLNFEKKAPSTIQNLQNQIDKKYYKINDLKSKINGVDQSITSLVEKRIGQKPGSEFEKLYDTLLNKYWGYTASTCFLIGFFHLLINTSLPLVLALFGAFVLIGPGILIGVVILITILQFIIKLLIGGDRRDKYQRSFDKLFAEIKKNKYYQSIQSTQKQIDNLENESDVLDTELRSIKKALYDIVSLKRKAKGKEDRAKIAAFNNKARSAASYVRVNLIKAIKNKKNWECPYCHHHYNISEGRFSKLTDADHIHPVHKGGLSTKQNMVIVCKKCNSKKKTQTLRQFCKTQKLNYEKTCSILEKMGKDV